MLCVVSYSFCNIVNSNNFLSLLKKNFLVLKTTGLSTHIDFDGTKKDLAKILLSFHKAIMIDVQDSIELYYSTNNSDVQVCRIKKNGNKKINLTELKVLIMVIK